MNKTEIKGDVGQLIQAETVTYQVYVALNEKEVSDRPIGMNSRQREAIAKAFLGSLLYIIFSVLMGIFSPDSLGFIANFAAFLAMFVCIASANIIFKKT